MSFDLDDDNSDDYGLPPGFDNKEKPEGPDFHVVMGRPVEPNDIERGIADKMGIDFSDPYDGSVKIPCKRCMREMWIGPKQQETMSDLGDCIVMCPYHAVETMNDLGADMSNVHSLGNVHPRGN